MVEKENNIAILVVDVIDGLHAREPVSDAATSPHVRDCLSMLQELATTGGGRVIKAIGDGIMCEFPDADAAALAACEMQACVQQNTARPARHISIRVGLHFGPPLTAGVTAQRMAVMAASGQIITTGETKALLSVQHGNAIRQHVLPARSKPESVTVYEILWQQDHERTQMPGSSISPAREIAGPGTQLRLIHAGRQIIVVASISIGRRESHGIVLHNPIASRDHALIERRQANFVLVDRSSHGTFIRLNNGYEHKISRNEMVLRGSGVISFAQPISKKAMELVSFWCEPDKVVATQAKRK